MVGRVAESGSQLLNLYLDGSGRLFYLLTRFLTPEQLHTSSKLRASFPFQLKYLAKLLPLALKHYNQGPRTVRERKYSIGTCYEELSGPEVCCLCLVEVGVNDVLGGVELGVGGCAVYVW